VSPPTDRAALLADVQQFLFLEARLQDDHEYAAWETLWTDDGVYWIPANTADGTEVDPEREMSILYDNRSRIRLRIKQLLTGRRHTQEPKSQLRRIIGNIELLSVDAKEIRVGANSMIFESSIRDDTIWSSRNEYVLRYESEGLKMAFKKVTLANNNRAIFTLSFLV
jgi:3-phenylpropionate/cinnamic acid dioxygenase small subunit